MSVLSDLYEKVPELFDSDMVLYKAFFSRGLSERVSELTIHKINRVYLCTQNGQTWCEIYRPFNKLKQ